MAQTKTKQLIQENKHLFWWVPENEKEDLSDESLVEAILSYGNVGSIKKLFDLFGIETVARIFREQISKKRVNYKPRTIHYFNLYFDEHA